MKKITIGLIMNLAFCIALPAQQLKVFAEKEIFDLENAFSHDSKELGFITANIKYASGEAVVFRPRMINAIEWSNKLKGTDSFYQITWYPSHIEASAAADLGYATGPFDNVSKDPKDSAENHGQFLTVWKRQDDGTMKFVIDFGSNQLPPAEFVKKEPVFGRFTGQRKYKEIDQSQSRQALLNVEKEFNQLGEVQGDVAAYRRYANKNIRFFYQRQFYVNGLENVIARIKDEKAVHTWKLLYAFVAKSGDLAYVYGTHEYRDGETQRSGYFLRIWKQEKSDWCIVAQVRSLLPKDAKPN